MHKRHLHLPLALLLLLLAGCGAPPEASLSPAPDNPATPAPALTATLTAMLSPIEPPTSTPGSLSRGEVFDPVSPSIALGRTDSFSDSGLELVSNPAGDVQPAIDRDIATLVSNVSRQQLFDYVQTLEGFGTRHNLSETNRHDFGIGAARNWIYDEFLRVGNGRLKVEFMDFNMNYNGLSTVQQNVIATLPGTGAYPGLVVLTAHYDSRNLDLADGRSLAPGADDNASGVAVILEVARLLSSRSWNQTIIFIAFAGEEHGTFGSYSYVQRAMLDGLLFDAVINCDIVGGRPGIPHSIRLFAQGPDTSPSSHLARYMDYIGQLYLPTFPVDVHETLDREGRFGDHREFIKVGVAAVRLTESIEDPNSQHNSRDTSEKLDYDYLAQVTGLNVATAASIAGGPARPPAPTISPTADPGVYLLAWVPDPLAAGYALSFRTPDNYYLPAFRYVPATDAGNIAVTGLENVSYFLSIAGIDATGRLGYFSPEVLIHPIPVAYLDSVKLAERQSCVHCPTDGNGLNSRGANHV